MVEEITQQQLIEILEKHNEILKDQNQILTLILEQMRYLR